MPWWSWSLKYQSLFFLMWRLIFFKKNELVPLDEYFKIVLNFVVQHFIMYHSSATTTDMTIILNIKLVQFFREINFTKISLKKNNFTTAIFVKMISHYSIRLSHPHTPLTMTFFRFRIEFRIVFKTDRNFIFRQCNTM